MHVASLTSATTISTQSRNCGSTSDKGCSVLSIACDMPVSLVTEYITTIILKDLYIYYYYYYYHFFFTSCRNCSWCPNKAGNAILLHWVLEHSGKPNKPPTLSHWIVLLPHEHVETWILRQTECSRCMLPSDTTSVM